MGLIEQLISALAVLMMIGGGVMLFVATDHAIQQVYRHSVEDELERRREREHEGEGEKEC